ncbi:MAG: amidohydrolase family protein [Acidobacteria bacterium]|nr:amidohydrolase family protein [Acidobacteriota bacterium]
MKRLLSFAICLVMLGGTWGGASAALAQGQRRGQGREAQPQGGETLIRNATILTVSHGTLAASDLLIRNGKIVAVGQNLKAAANARVIDATGKFVLPGIIDAHSHTMMDGSVNECTQSVTSMARTQDILNPTAINIYRELAGGVTSALLLHGSCNSIGGQSTTVKFKYGRPAAEFIFPGAPPGIKFALGENPKRTNFTQQPGQQRYPATRMGVEETIRGAFTRARDYKRGWDEFRAATARGDKNVLPPRRDLTLEPLVEVLEGKRYVHSHSYTADEIVMLINLADEFGFKVRTFQHVLEGYKVAGELARHGAMASTFADFWSYKVEAYDAIPYNSAIMTRHGVVTSVNSDSDERARRLNIDAAKMMRYGGLTEEEALRLVTLNPAMQLGVDSRVGSIDVGKDADLAIWTAHPLSVYSRVETTFIDGDIFFDRTQDLAHRTQLEQERKTLEQADANKAPAAGATPPATPRPPRRAYTDDDDVQDEGNNQR